MCINMSATSAELLLRPLDGAIRILAGGPHLVQDVYYSSLIIHVIEISWRLHKLSSNC